MKNRLNDVKYLYQGYYYLYYPTIINRSSEILGTYYVGCSLKQAYLKYFL